MKKEYIRTLILSLIAVVCLAIGISLTIIGAINISNGIKKTSDNDNKSTTHIIGIKSTITTTNNKVIISSTSSLDTTTKKHSNVPYYPPRSGIVFGIMSGNDMNIEGFQYIVQNMIPNIISNKWTHSERIGASNYNLYIKSQIVLFNEPNYNTIKKNISSFTWFPDKINISTQLNNIRQDFLRVLPLEDKYMQTIIFTSNNNKEDIENSISDAMILNESGQLIIIGVGRNVDKTLLQKLTKNVLIWYYGGNDKQIINELENLIVNFNPNYFTVTTTLPPSTISTIKYKTSKLSNSSRMSTSKLVTKLSTIKVTTEIPNVNYNPCFTNIIFSIDTSSDILTPIQFQEEITLINDYITLNWNHYERVALTSYDENVDTLYTFNTIVNSNDFQLKINTFTQSKGSSLTKLLSGLLTLQTSNQKDLSIFIFISKLNYADLQFAKIYSKQLLKKSKLNFIILDKNVNPYDLVSLNASKIISYNFTKEDIPNIKNFFATSYSCNFIPSIPLPLTKIPTLSTTTTTLSTTTISNIYYPPKSAIIFAIDSTKNIDNSIYQNIKYLVTNKLINSQWNYPSRIGVFGYDSNKNTETSPFGLSTFNYIKQIVDGFKQLPGNCSISTGLKETKLQYYTSLKNDIKYMQTIIFTSCSSIDDINNAIVDAFFLREMGQLIIVGIGENVKVENLLKLSNKVLIWSGDINDNNIFNILEKWIVNFNPYDIETTTSTTSLTKTTTITKIPTTFLPSIPYYPCKTNIILAIDASSDVMTDSQFNKEINLIKNTIISNWTHYDRVALSWYNNLPSTFFSYNTINDKKNFEMILTMIKQEPGYNLSKLLSTLTYLKNMNTFKTSTFIFISKVDNNDIENSRIFANILLKEGTLNFITIGNNITSEGFSKLLSLNPSNIFQWNYNNSSSILKYFDQSMDC
ncbi:von Willebrand factor, type A domain-containing protein [Strongyloides ratti]|uniref:von Willebrand factor, type A domain-containing protein n=1 Tax=Strongyloides ratti TaxID=34506 RepID=A0A090L1E6_STRRB|nr:von Willebrand factor, type A domain-containing protein [Strongyloides ratti]CEF61942.1 von Willebrand factor, type A domain-containing protein [Strongyloides ratti]